MVHHVRKWKPRSWRDFEGRRKKMKLLLTSNGITSPDLEKAFLEMTNGRTDLKVAIIPTAGDPIEWVPEKEGSENYIARLVHERKAKNDAWKQGCKKEWENKGYDAILADLTEDPDVLREKLEKVDLIVVEGGDVNYLLDWAKKSKLDTYLKDLLDKGVVYVGTSAGSGLLNPDIGLTWWEPREKWAGTDRMGLGIVDFIIVPHQKESELLKSEENLIKRKKYLQSVINFPWKVYLVQDGQAIKVTGSNIEHIGPGSKRIV